MVSLVSGGQLSVGSLGVTVCHVFVFVFLCGELFFEFNQIAIAPSKGAT